MTPETAAKFASALAVAIERNTALYQHPYKKDEVVTGVLISGVENHLRDKGWKGLRNGLIEESVRGVLQLKTERRAHADKLKGAEKGVRTAYVAWA